MVVKIFVEESLRIKTFLLAFWLNSLKFSSQVAWLRFLQDEIQMYGVSSVVLSFFIPKKYALQFKQETYGILLSLVSEEPSFCIIHKWDMFPICFIWPHKFVLIVQITVSNIC